MTFSTNPLRLVMALGRQRRTYFVFTAILWALIHSSPIIFGLAMRGVFDALSGAAGAGANAWSYLALGLGTDALRILMFVGGIYTWATWWLEITLHVRSSLLRYLVEASGSRRLPDSPSEAVTRFRDDVNDIGEYYEYWCDFWGFAAFALAALATMLTINPVMTVLASVPLALTVLLTRLLRPHIRNARRLSREATSRVTDFLGETFGSVQAVKASGREPFVLRHFATLNSVRKKRALTDTLLTELFRSVTDNMVNIATGIILLLGAAALKDGSFTVGDFALFVTYLPRLTQSLSFMGLMVVQHKRTGVAFERLGRLLVDAPVDALVTPRSYDLEHPQAPFVRSLPRVAPFERLDVVGLTAHHPGGARGVEDVTLSVRRGEFVVVTGRVGSGKTTLLRALLGLLPRDAGSVAWNGALVTDPASFFVPPRAAYTSQVPRLFSDTLRENVVMGADVSDADVTAALELAVLGPDLANMRGGLDTEVGTRGVRLSGGQVQRAAAARMLLRGAELLVFDDISSALDVETERRLWDGLFVAGGTTCLVVSHRRAALERADRVIVLEEGRVVAQGRLADVLDEAPELGALLRGEHGESARADGVAVGDAAAVG
ncbi:MAG: ABC transporter ATP-binding protein [Trueperaceae bacterium]|nr:ABC transporter ATP-binding protein [Trueperaceae bacterium]MCC6311442.1 ABC transporter ATP-binding protein [Trueperaceae bacterium]MCO5172688.1 ABC transporter ATP-binding protein/permease [Trueperaceae bacterium]MCW5819460.1 ABC transporter ATP-binding protein [Trueperaceae bacterium]